MKNWHYGTNTYYKTAHICVDILPWYLYYLERVVEWFCCYFPNIPFPSWLHYTDKDDGSVYTWKEWWGGTSSLFHCYIHNPIFNFVYNREKYNTFQFEVDYEKLKEFIKNTDKKEYEYMIMREKENEQDKERESKESDK